MVKSQFSFGAATRVLATRLLLGAGCAAFLALAGTAAFAQVITIDSQGRAVNGNETNVDRRFAQIQPTKIELPPQPLNARTRTQLIRDLEGEQGFAMRPFPRGHRGLTLEANGKLDPVGGAYLDMVTAQGLCAKPGDRVVITDLKFDHNKIIFMLNGGPDAKHRFLRHIQIGMGGPYDDTTPVVPDDGQAPTGARLTLAFKDRVPELTGEQIKSLLAPLISFNVKTPVEAFTDTLPPKLRQAILNHQVMVGMSTDMVMFALGRPESKMREMDGQMPVEIWMYGKPPDTVRFVRINGNRVIRVEIAEVGKPPQVFTEDVVTPMLMASGTQIPAEPTTRTVAMGDVVTNPDTQAAAPAPTLRKTGEALPQDQDKNGIGAMGPVRFPKQQADDYPDASKLPRTQQPADAQAGGAKPPVKDGDKPKDSDKKETPPPPANPPAPAPPAAQQQ